MRERLLLEFAEQVETLPGGWRLAGKLLRQCPCHGPADGSTNAGLPAAVALCPW